MVDRAQIIWAYSFQILMTCVGAGAVIAVTNFGRWILRGKPGGR